MLKQPKIVFIQTSISDAHTRHRVEDFMAEGFQVEVCGFLREGAKIPSLPYEVRQVGVLRNNRYAERLWIYMRAFFHITRAYRGQDVVYYLCGLDTALFFRLLHPCEKYIYEECDLMHYDMNRMPAWLRSMLETLDKYIIRHSLATLTTSEGFLRFHYGQQMPPRQVILVENKLSPAIRKVKPQPHKPLDVQHLTIGFAGGLRYESIHHFIHSFCTRYPQHQFEVFGAPVPPEFEALGDLPNCHMHGRFTNPDDLPQIYASVDLMLCTYDQRFKNVCYAEPNKLYESLFFHTPIIVSQGTFLAEKVKQLGVGFAVDAFSDESIDELLADITCDSITQCQQNMQHIDVQTLISNSHVYLTKLKNFI